MRGGLPVDTLLQQLVHGLHHRATVEPRPQSSVLQHIGNGDQAGQPRLGGEKVIAAAASEDPGCERATPDAARAMPDIDAGRPGGVLRGLLSTR